MNISIQMSPGEQKFLWKKVEELPDGIVIVEIGTLFGGSAAIICDGRKFKKTRFFTIDSYEAPDTSFEITRSNLNKEGFDNLEIIKGKSVEVSKTWDLPIDCLLIDGDHQFESVKSDIEYWIPKVKKGGLVLFHDYESWPGVTQAVDQAIKQEILKRGDLAGTLLYTTKL